ncbi:MAG: MarR family transcriptional regulator [Lacunisphaera sp.]
MPYLLLKDLPRYECLLEAAKEFPDLDPSAAEAFLHLLRTGDEVFGYTDKNLSDHNISHGRFGVMMLLWRSVHPRAEAVGDDTCNHGPRTPAELADAAGVTRATMTGLIDTLERDGFVKREPDPNDRRMMSVRLTPEGRRFLEGYLPGYFQAMASLMSPLSESERKTLVRLLGKVQQHAATLNAVKKASTSTSAH